jgi:phage terminase small subunit
MTMTVIDGGDGLPPEPDWSKIFSDDMDIAEVREHWGIVVRELQAAGTLAVSNGHSIKRLVEFRFQYERASRHVAEVGPIVKAKRTKVPQYNLQWIVMRQADDSIRLLEAELGISPTRRGKAVKVQRGKKATRPADEFLRR